MVQRVIAIALLAIAALTPATPAQCAAIGGIAPHHDLAVDMIDRFYNKISSETGEVRRVFLFAPDHFKRATRWVTIGGDVDVVRALSAPDRAACDELFARDHAATVHLPFIKNFFLRRGSSS